MQWKNFLLSLDKKLGSPMTYLGYFQVISSIFTFCLFVSGVQNNVTDIYTSPKVIYIHFNLVRGNV